MHIKVLLLAALCAGAAADMAQAAATAPYPDHPLRLILPFPTGGPTDIVARTFGQKLGEALGQQVVVDNRGGAGGNIGAQTVARACGKSHLHNLEPEDLCALTVEAAAMAQVPLAGTSWIPGRGGSFSSTGAVLVNGMLYINCGYSNMPGNVLLAFGLP